MRARWYLVIALLAAGSLIAATALGTDEPHNPAFSPDFSGDKYCGACHIPHNAFGTLFNPGAQGASTVNQLCEGCHNDATGVAPEVLTHGSARGTAGCDFCTYDFEVACINCHNPHSHEQPYENDPVPDGIPDAFIRSAIKLWAPGCTDSTCDAGFHNDDLTKTCVADQSCETGTCPAAVDDCQTNPSGDMTICVCDIGADGTCAGCLDDATAKFTQNGGGCDGVGCGAINDKCGYGTCIDDCLQSTCAVGEHHRDTNPAAGTCDPDETCDDDPAGGYTGDVNCRNGGTCTPTGSDIQFVCDCPVGTTGADCGTCASGFTLSGGLCVADCGLIGVGNPCGYGGQCAQSSLCPADDCPVGSYYDELTLSCKTADGTGNYRIGDGDCSSNPCQHTTPDKCTTVESGKAHVCECPVGTTGPNCETCVAGFVDNVTSCDPYVCQPGDEGVAQCGVGGTCEAGGGGPAPNQHPSAFTVEFGTGNGTEANAYDDNTGTSADLAPNTTVSWHTVNNPGCTGATASVVLWLQWSATGTFDNKKPDNYTIEYSANNGGSWTPWQSGVSATAGTTLESADVSGSFTDCSQLPGNIRFRAVFAQNGGADSATLHIDEAWVVVSTSGGGAQCNGTCTTGYAGASCDACDTVGGYVRAPDGSCSNTADATDVCTTTPCSAGTCIRDSGGTRACVCDAKNVDDLGECDGCGVAEEITDYCDPDADGTAGCTAGYLGDCDTCDTPTYDNYGDATCRNSDPCSGVACNDGTCYVDDTGAGLCDCPGRYTGADCTTQSAGCGGVVCDCDPGYTGLACDACDTAGGYVQKPDGTCIDDPCDPNPCKNGAACYVDASGSAACDCVGQYYGATCNSCDVAGPGTQVPVVLVTQAGTTDSLADGDGGNFCEVCHDSTGHFQHPGGTIDIENNKPGGEQHNKDQNCLTCHVHRKSLADPRQGGWGFVPVPNPTSGELCADCHLVAGTADTDSYAWNGNKAMIGYDEWVQFGHGASKAQADATQPSGNQCDNGFQTPANEGTTYPSGNGCADFDVEPTPGTNHGCEYCHDYNVPHNDPQNYFRLRNYDALARGTCGTGGPSQCIDGTACADDTDCAAVAGEPANDVCLMCHAKNAGGYDPDSDGVPPGGWASLNSTLDIDTDTPWKPFHHKLAQHKDPSQRDGSFPDDSNGGKYCWDCHDPHGDSAQDGASPNWVMIQKQPTQDSNFDSGGVPYDSDGDDAFLSGGDGIIEGLANGVSFYAGVAGNTSLLDIADFREPGAGGQALCRNCHDSTAKQCNGRFSDPSQDCSVTGFHPEDQGSFNPDIGCVAQCHNHDNAFKGENTNATCFSCHGTDDATGDRLNYTAGDVEALINMYEFGGRDTGNAGPSSNTGSGHGRTGTAYPSGNPAAALQASSGAIDGACYYCHTTTSGHQGSPHPFSLDNPFLLTNRNALGGGDNDVCLVCHDGDNATGYDPPADALGNDAPIRCDGTVDSTCVSTTKGGSVKIKTAHQHGSGFPTGTKCWHCHDPHGDGNDFMIQYNAYNKLLASASDPCIAAGGTGCPDYVPIDATPGNANGVTLPITFTPGSTPVWDDYKVAASGSGGPLCGRCHPTDVGNCNQGACGGHNAGQPCTNCHPHDGDFQGQGVCRDCHGTSQQPASSPKRRAVDADFALNSHHVGTGGAAMGGVLTNFDCVTCHVEGYSNGQCDVGGTNTCSGSGSSCSSDDDCIKLGSSSVHMDGKIHLRDVDSTLGESGGYFIYDKDCVADSTIPGCETSTNTFDMTNPIWVSETRDNLDPFCLGCHDYDGASVAAGGSWGAGGTGKVAEDGATAGNPFNDAAITNEYDQALRPNRAPFSDARGSIVDIRTMVDASLTAQACGGGIAGDGTARSGFCVGNPTIACTGDYDAACPSVGGTNDPPKGKNARHAIRGQAASRYVDRNCGTCGGGQESLWQAGLLNAGWDDASVMSCADCHTTDGGLDKPGLTNTGNAHGANSEYLLRDASRGSTEGTYTAGTLVCYQCHVSGTYGKKHGSNNGQEWGDTMAEVGYTNRTAVPGTIWGMNCLLCHGGSEWGGIHGTSHDQGWGPAGSSGTRPSYRFMNGAVMRFMNPDLNRAEGTTVVDTDWEAANYSCYTVSGSTSFGTCTQHSASGGRDGPGRNLQRPLSY